MQMNLSNKKLSQLKTFIDFKKNYVMALTKRMVLIKKDYSKKCEYERNEIDVVMYETLSLISSANKSIEDAEKKYEEELICFCHELNEVDLNYENLLQEAKKKQSENHALKYLLYNVNWKYVNDNIEEKINLYNAIKESL